MRRSRPLYRLLWILVAAMIIIVPWVFWRGNSTAFWISLALVCVIGWVAEPFSSRREGTPDE